MDHSETLAKVSALTPRSGVSGGRLSHSTSPKKPRGHFSETQHRGEKKDEGAEKTKSEEEGNEKGDTKQKESNECERDYAFDFTMCNPPFFSSEDEVDTMAKSKKGRGEPCAAPTGKN